MAQQPSTLDPALVVAQTGWVQRLARSLVRDPSGADDVAQETLLAALSAPPRDAQNEERLRAWLGRVAFNLANLAVRRNARRRAREERVARAEPQASTVERVAREASLMLVVETVEELAEPYRSAIVQRYFEGLSSVEIARRAGTTESAIRKRLYRGRQKLRESLDARHNGERQAWFRALAPLCPGGALALSTPGSGSGPIAPVAPVANSAQATGAWLGAAAALAGLAGTWWILPDRVPTTEATVLAQAGTNGPESVRGARLVQPGPAAGTQRTSGTGGPGPASDRTPARPAADRETNEAEGPRSDPPERLTGPVVSGSVVDLAGRPLAGVQLFRSGDERVLGHSAPDGSFDVAVGTLPVRLEARGETVVGLHAARVERGEQGWRQVIVAAPALRLSGRVIDANGQPLPRATMSVVADDEAFLELDWAAGALAGSARAGFGDRLQPEASADERGVFDFGRVATGPGLYLRTEAVGHEVDWRRLPSNAWTPSLDLLVALEPTDANQRLGGLVLDDEGRAVPGVRIQVGEQLVLSDASGRFDLDLPAGQPDAVLVARKGGYDPSIIVDVGARGGARRTMLVRMSRAVHSIEGVVVDERGRPQADWMVVATLPQEDAGSEAVEFVLPEAERPVDRTDADGRFRLTRLSQRSYRLLAFDPETLCCSEEPSVRAGGAGVVLRVDPEAQVAGTQGVLVDQNAVPLTQATVALSLEFTTQNGSWSHQTAAMTTDSRGRFLPATLPSSMGLGADLSIRVRHPRLGSLRGELPLVGADGQHFEVQVAVPRTVRLEGFAGDAFEIHGEDGRRLPLGGRRLGGSRRGLFSGRTAYFALDPTAQSVVWYRNGERVGEQAIQPESSDTVRFVP